MEEDLKTLEKLKDKVSLFSTGWSSVLSTQETQALDHLIQAYKDQQAELEKKDKYIELLKHRVEVETKNTGSLATRVVEMSIELEKKVKIIDKMAEQLDGLV